MLQNKSKKLLSFAHRKFPNHFVPSINLTMGAQLIGGDNQSAVDVLNTLVTYMPPMIDLISKLSCFKDGAELSAHINKLHLSLLYCGTPKLSLLTKYFLQAAKRQNKIKMCLLKQRIIKEANEIQIKFSKIKQ
jgi:hypothetical protein